LLTKSSYRWALSNMPADRGAKSIRRTLIKSFCLL
jgi:hypothetical protein